MSESTLSVEGSPASPSATTATGSPRTTSDGSGRSSPDAFAYWDRGTSSWRTCQLSLLEEWATLSETWPTAGTTWNGRCYRRERLVPHTVETECSLLPTPTASDAKRMKEFSAFTLVKSCMSREPGERYLAEVLAGEYGLFQRKMTVDPFARYTDRAKKVMELAFREALQLGHNYIGTEHILLGLVREGEGVAAQVLVNRLDLSLAEVRRAVVQQLNGYATEDLACPNCGKSINQEHDGTQRKQCLREIRRRQLAAAGQERTDSE